MSWGARARLQHRRAHEHAGAVADEIQQVPALAGRCQAAFRRRRIPLRLLGGPRRRPRRRPRKQAPRGRARRVVAAVAGAALPDGVPAHSEPCPGSCPGPEPAAPARTASAEPDAAGVPAHSEPASWAGRAPASSSAPAPLPARPDDPAPSPASSPSCTRPQARGSAEQRRLCDKVPAVGCPACESAPVHALLAAAAHSRPCGHAFTHVAAHAFKRRSGARPHQGRAQRVLAWAGVGAAHRRREHGHARAACGYARL